MMIYLSSWMTTLPIMIIGMVGIILVIGIIVLAEQIDPPEIMVPERKRSFGPKAPCTA